jgi:acyl-coenzyme A synthetase/AMP-(fatty) acid ligase
MPTAFATSGTTGEPVTWLRTEDQLRAEAAILAELTDAGQADGIVCYAPPTHLYGHLMGVVLPELTGLPCRFLAVTESPTSGLRRPLIAALPAAVTTMARNLSALRRLDRLTLVHGSAELTEAAADLLAARPARLVDLFGSTETGLVGWRTDPTADWRPAPDVTLASEPDGRLRVRGPRIAHRDGRPASDAVLDDLVVINPDGTFRWLGRATRLLKVNGLRVHLDQVEATLRAAVPGAAIRCHAEPDPVRGEWFSVLVSGADVDAVRSACGTLPAASRPRTVRAA